MSTGIAHGGLTQYWTFDGNLANDVSGGLEATPVGSGVSVVSTPGEFVRGTGALKIAHETTSGDYLSVEGPILPQYNPSAFSVSTWFKFDQTLGSQPNDIRNFLFETTPTWSAGVGLRDDGAGNRKLEWYSDGSDFDIYEATGLVVNDGRWHHLAVVHDASDQDTLYLDGGLVATSVSNVPVQPTTGMNIGSHRTGDGTRNWKGYIDDFAVYEGTLDASGVFGLFTGQYTPQTVPVVDPYAPPQEIPTAPLQAYWTFDSDYASEVHNEFYQGVPYGGEHTSITNTPGGFIRGTGALKLDSGPASGNGTYVDIPREVADPARDRQITVSAWYKYSDISGDGSDVRNFVWESSPGYSLSYGLREESGVRDGEWFFEGGMSDTTGPKIVPDEWTHVVMVLDQDAGRIQYYHNGALVDDISGGGNIPAMDGFHIGNHRAADGSRDFDGYIDDVAVFHGILSPEAVQGLYDGTHSPLTVPVSEGFPPVFEPAPFVEGSWTMVALPDTQVYAANAAYAPIFNQMTQWIVDAKEERNIALVITEGDITNDNTVVQWERAKSALSALDGEVPYILVQGNHDINSSRGTLMNDYFDAGDNRLNDPDQGGILVGTHEEGKLENAYYDFTAPDGRKMLLFALEYGPRQVIVDWANDIAARPEYADHTAVLVTHAYMYNDDNRLDWATYGTSQVANPHAYSAFAPDVHDGQELWDELVKVNENFEMVHSGHVIGAAQSDGDGTGYRADDGVSGNAAHQFLFNAQHLAEGGTGWLRLYEFLPDGKTVRVKTYSPYLDTEGRSAWRVDEDDWFEFELSPLYIVGDLNGDGSVGSADLDIVRAHWGQDVPPGSFAHGDASGDGAVGSADLDIIRARWGNTSPSAVPEPAAGVLLFAGFVLTVRLRRRESFKELQPPSLRMTSFMP